METKLKFIEKIKKVKIKPGAIPCIIFAFALMTTTQGYCDATVSTGIDSMAIDFKNLIFNYWVRMILLSASALMGVVQCFKANSPMPLLSWGLLAFLLGYLPKIVEHLSKVGI